jgi:hypothetical protein
MTPHYRINGTPVYLVNGTHWVTEPIDIGNLTISGSGSYSIGGGAVAQVPQGPAMAVTATKPEAPAEYATVKDAAEAALSYAAGRKPEQPRWYRLVVLPQEKPCTADTIEAAIRELNPKRSAPLDISRLTVGLVDWQRTGTLYLVEGIEVRT